MESMAIESHGAAGGDRLERYHYEVYRPDPTDLKEQLAAMNVQTSDDEELAMFDAFSSAIGDMH